MFETFSPSHLAVLGVIVFAGILLCQLVRRYPLQKSAIHLILALSLILNETITFIYRSYQGTHLLQRLPLHISDITALAVVITLLTGRQLIFEISYYWGFSASALAMITPDLTYPFPSPSAVLYFLTHGLVIMSIIMFIWGENRRPGAGSNLRAFGIMNAYALLIGIFNIVFRTNYFFILRKPSSETLLDYFGPWPYYILTAEIFAFIIFWLLWLPFRARK